MNYSGFIIVSLLALSQMSCAGGDSKLMRELWKNESARQLAEFREEVKNGGQMIGMCGISVRPLDQDGAYAFQCFNESPEGQLEVGIFAVTKTGAFFTPLNSTPKEMQQFNIGMRTSMQVNGKTYYAMVMNQAAIGFILAAVSDSPDFKSKNTSWAFDAAYYEKNSKIGPTVAVGKTRKIEANDEIAQLIISRVNTFRNTK